MKTLQFYFLRELTGPFILGVVFFTFLMILRQLFAIAEFLLESGVGAPTIVELLVIISVSMMILTVPMAALLACLVGIGRLTAENEVLAVRAAGISVHRAFYFVVILAALLSVALLIASQNFLPRLAQSIYEKKTEIQFELLTNLEPRRIYGEIAPKDTDISLYYREKLPNKETDSQFTLRMKDVTMRFQGEERFMNQAGLDLGEEQNEVLIFAANGLIRGDMPTRSLHIVLENGTLYPVNRKEATQTTTLEFDSMQQVIYPEGDDDRDDKIIPGIMSLSELMEIAKNEPEGPMWRVEEQKRMRGKWKAYLLAKNEIMQRFSLPFATLAFVLIAIPLAIELRLRSKTISFLIAIGLVLVYYMMLTFGNAIGMTNSPWAFLAMFSPNLVLAAVGLFLFWWNQNRV